MLLGVRIKALREGKNLTQQELANMINVTKSTISYYENDKRVPTVGNLHDLARALNVSYDYLMGNDFFEVADETEINKYGTYMSKEEIQFIKEIRRYSKLHDQVIKDPVRCVKLINKELS